MFILISLFDSGFFKDFNSIVKAGLTFIFLILSIWGYTQIDSLKSGNQNQILPFISIVEKSPQFPGGEKAMVSFIEKNLVYPKMAMDSGIEGTVKLRFTVTPYGEIKDIVVLLNDKKIGYGLEEAAVDVISKMPLWIAGSQNGILTPLPYTLSIPFNLILLKDTAVPLNSVHNDSYSDKVPLNVYLISTLKPQFPGGKEAMMEFISTNLIYPKTAIENKIEGKVVLKFIIDSLGKICCIDFIGPPLGYGLESEAIRIVKTMPLWIPAAIDDMPVAVYYRLPIVFKYYEE